MEQNFNPGSALRAKFLPENNWVMKQERNDPKQGHQVTAPVVQRVDSAIHRKANCTILGIEIYPVDIAIHPLYNQ